MNRFLILFLFLTILSCGKSEEDKIENGMDLAQQLLSEGNCEAAQTELDGVGYQNTNARYIKLYASTQACKANYSTPVFFGTDLSKLGTSNTAFLGSLTTFSTSDDLADLNDEKYNHLKSAINTLLYAGGLTASSNTNRKGKFTTAEVNNIDAFAMYLILIQMGRYFYHVGNTNDLGQKGARDTATTNDCLSDYTTAASQAARVAATASIVPCTADNDGYTELQSASGTRMQRLCEGVTLFNNFFDILTSLSFTGSSAGSLTELKDSLTDLCGALGAVCTVKDQATCESTITAENLELYFVGVFETMLTGP